MIKQNTDTILMVKPAHFGFNEQTAKNNAFQNLPEISDVHVKENAKAEFDHAVKLLLENGVKVIVIEDTQTPVKPDAIFPNNWFSTHQKGVIITYPMASPNRRIERRQDVVQKLIDERGYKISVDLSHYERFDLFLEGTGSMIFDRLNKVVYACRSIRTNGEVLSRFCDLSGYRAELFTAQDRDGIPIYHTNVMMAMGKDEVVICLDSVRSAIEKQKLLEQFVETGKTVVELTFDQMVSFAGNMLQVRNDSGQLIWIMSQAAHDSLNNNQLETLSRHSGILAIPIPTIERVGGGSIRCMMAEVF